MAGIDFSRYSVEELRQAQESIDAEQYPENYARLMAELAKPERQQQEQDALRAQEIKSHDMKMVLARTLLVITGIGTFFMAFSFYSDGVITGKYDRVIVRLVDNPVGFYFGLVVTGIVGLSMFYAGLTGKGLKKNSNSQNL